MGWEGEVSGVFGALQTLLSDAKASLGLGQVTIGERRRGWEHDPAELFLAPQGVTPQQGSRHGDQEVMIPVQVQTRKRHATESQEDEVLTRLEKIADQVKTDPTLGGRVRESSITGFRITSYGVQDDARDGAYETTGLLDIEYTTHVTDRS